MHILDIRIQFIEIHFYKMHISKNTDIWNRYPVPIFSATNWDVDTRGEETVAASSIGEIPAAELNKSSILDVK